MKILAITPYQKGFAPGQRYRIEQWESDLTGYGVEIDFVPFETSKLKSILYQDGYILKKAYWLTTSLIKRLSLLLKLAKYDLIYIFREVALLGPAFFESLLAKSKIPIVYDFDDAIFLPNVSDANAKFAFLKFPEKTASICKISKSVMVGNRYLAEYAGKYNKNVDIIPSTIDTDEYVTKESYENFDIPTIVWSGSITTLQHLQTLSPVLQKLAEIREFKLRVIGAAEYKLKGVEIENRKWSAETEVRDLRNCDIGIMPLPDDAWSRGKCGMKALQYMGIGLPTVCSDVGANSDIIQHNENGLLSSSQEDWIENLTKLIDSVLLRKNLGTAGRRTVQLKYSAKANVPKVYEIFRAAIRED
jgi:glycosyltransferase involved in cell wall biosynthesis